jgi:hypothetical protein
LIDTRYYITTLKMLAQRRLRSTANLMNVMMTAYL